MLVVTNSAEKRCSINTHINYLGLFTSIDKMSDATKQSSLETWLLTGALLKRETKSHSIYLCLCCLGNELTNADCCGLNSHVDLAGRITYTEQIMMSCVLIPYFMFHILIFWVRTPLCRPISLDYSIYYVSLFLHKFYSSYLPTWIYMILYNVFMKWKTYTCCNMCLYRG